jgi:hypothetical protein
MKKNVLIFALLLLVAAYANATKKRVNNNNGVNANYSTFLAAYNAASSGDTIYLEGSLTAYTPPDSIKKKLVVIGPGYFLELNDSTQANKAPATFSPQVSFGKGSEGSVFMGITFGQVYVIASNITLARNYIADLALIYTTQLHLTNIIIKQNYIAGTLQNWAGYGSCSNTQISNNIIYNMALANTSSNYVVKNNIFTYYLNALQMYNATAYNNIITGPYYQFPTGQNNTGTYNIFGVAGTNADGNQYGVNMANVFEQTGSTDGYYKLKAGSPAIGTGASGVNCGVFGNTEPYVLSGLAPIPHIFNVNIQGDGSSSGLPVIVKAKSQK